MDKTFRITKKSYNIWLVTIGEPLPIESGVRLHRTGMLCEQLLKKGHNVIWWTSAFDHNNKKMLYNEDFEIKKSDNFTIKLIKGLGYSKNITIKRLLDHYIISLKLKKYFKKNLKPDIIITSIPCYHISYQAVTYAQHNHVPIITDLRDLWPDIFTLIVRNKFLKKLINLLLTNDYYRLKYCFRKATGLIAISPGYLMLSARRGKRMITESDKCFLLGSKPYTVSKPIEKLNHIINKIKDKKVFAFVGSFGETYELSLVISAAKYFERHNKEVAFLFIGKGKQESYLKNELKNLHNVILTGWLSSEDIKICLGYSMVGLMPYINFATQSIPNKFFDYLASGLPVLSSINNIDMKELLENYRIGFYYDAGNEEKFISLCEGFIENDDLINECSENAKIYFQKYGNSDVIYFNYAEHIEKVIKEYNRQEY